MDVGAGGSSGGAGERTMTKQTSGSSIINMSERVNIEAMNVSRINALRTSINRHSDTASKLLLSGKDTLERRATIESAFRVCRKIFQEISTVLINLLEERSAYSRAVADNIKKAVSEALDERDSDSACGGNNSRVPSLMRSKTFASAVGASAAEVRVAGSPALRPANTTCFTITPDEGSATKFPTALSTREALCRVLRPSECGLRVNRISLARDNGVRIEAFSPDLDKIKAHPGLAKAGLIVKENLKINPRLIVHGIPSDMSAAEIKEELIAQNLSMEPGKDFKVVYIFTPKHNKGFTSCIIEVTPDIRRILIEESRVFLRFSACKVADHIRILQCFKCLQFGHIAKNCTSKPSCGHCAADHETRDCKERKLSPTCFNCKQLRGTGGDLAHMATDTKKCPIICRRIKDKTTYINYG